jgi:hypothetical protein
MRFCAALVILTMTSPVYAQTMGSSSGASSSVNINSPSASTNRLITTPTVAAPGLAAAGIETCLGSSAGGLSLMGGGFTFGSTKVDDGCTIRLLARQLYAFGFQKAAMALMCEDQHVALAMAEVGSPCPDRRIEVSDAAPNPAQSPLQQSAQQPALQLLRPSIQERGALSAQASAQEQIQEPTQEPIQEPIQESSHLAFAPVTSFSQQEREWFDRESNVN